MKQGSIFISRRAAAALLIAAAILVVPGSAHGWAIETVESNGDVGRYTSLALDADDHPHISYRDWSNHCLKYAAWNGTAWAVETVDSGDDVGYYISLALDADGHPHISYYDATNTALKYATLNGTAWENKTVESGDHVGLFTSLALDTAGYPHISYYAEYPLGDLKYAAWNGTAWENQTVDSAGYMGSPTSLALDTAGYPHISYSNDKFDLKYAAWNGTVWEKKTVDNGSVGQVNSLALDAAGNPHISYCGDMFNPELTYATWNGTAWAKKIVDSGDDVGSYNSIALDAEGNPHISYYDDTNEDLKYAAWDGTAWENATVDSSDDNVGEDTSIALDAEGYPHISYYADLPLGDLKYARLKPLHSDFSATPRSGAAPLTVAFTDNSSSWDHSTTWWFGDGGYSSEPHPSHTYASPGTYTVYLTVTDATETVTSTRAGYITVTAAPSRDGGGGPSNTAVALARGLAGGDNVTLSLDPSKSAFYGIEVTVNGTVAELLVTTRDIASPGSRIPLPDGTVFQFIEVRLYKTTDDLIDQAEIMFTVPLDWLDEEGFDPADVFLYRWHDGAWQALPTVFVKEEGGKAYFTGTSPGFSLFAIAGVEQDGVGEEAATVPAEEPGVAATVTVTVTEEATEPVPSEPLPADTAPTPAATQSPLLWAPVLALGGMLLLRRR